jgi:PAS domain S-box-containing protein
MAATPTPPGGLPDAARREAVTSTLSQLVRSVLEDVGRRTDFTRVVAMGTIESEVVGLAHGVADAEVVRFTNAFVSANGDGLTLLSSPHHSPVEELTSMHSPHPVSRTSEAGLSLVVVVDGEADHPDIAEVDEILHTATTLAASGVELHNASSHVRNLEALLRRARSSLDALPDPVLIMDSDWRIQFANRRAEELFVIGADDSQGRRHALETNNLYFSAFRARALLEQTGGRSRELVLVDPTTGSDLLFEVSAQPFGDSEDSTASSIFVLRDITDLKLATHELEIQFGRAIAAQHREHRESERLNVIIENAGVPILVTDPQANVVLINREAAGLLSADASDTASQLPDVRVNDAKLAGFINEFLLQPNSRREGRLDLIASDGERGFPALVVSTKILDDHGEAIAVVTLLRDLTQEAENQRLAQELRTFNAQLEERIVGATHELAERNAQLERQSVELKRASRLKSEFLATMSHELRTPINAVIGYSSLLRDGLFGELTDGQQDALRRMRNATEHLLSLINDILDLSRVEAGQIQVSATDIDLRSALESISESVRPLAAQKDLQFVLVVDPSIPRLRTDARRLRQVLLNLLSNAVKFTERGSVTLSAMPVAAGERVRMEVIDTGIGIAPADQHAIFDEFTQADQSATRQHGGTGLGLTISRKLIQVMGGQLGVTSELGRGSTFYVELPVLPPVLWGDVGTADAEAEAASSRPLGD